MSNPNILSVRSPYAQNLYTITQDTSWAATNYPNLGPQPGPVNAPEYEGVAATSVKFYSVDAYQEGGSIGILNYTPGLQFSAFQLTAGITYLLTAQLDLTGDQNPSAGYTWYNLTAQSLLDNLVYAQSGEILQQTITPEETTNIILLVAPSTDSTQVFKVPAQVTNARAIIQAIGVPTP